ncbi:hypothetical protein PRNO82_00837 [Planktothrix rubescens]|nr:hypothetical protein PRNO82_00837 [Planktothrix rubescens]
MNCPLTQTIQDCYTYEEALNDVRPAILFHIETFGESLLESESSILILEAFVAEISV